MSTRRPKLPPLPDLATTSPLRLLCLVVKTARNLSYPAFGNLLGVGEFKAKRLCVVDEADGVSAQLRRRIIDEAATQLRRPASLIEQWATSASPSERPRLVSDAIAAAFADANPLRRLRLRARRPDGGIVGVEEFAASLGLSRQRLHVLENRDDCEALQRAVDRARSVWGIVEDSGV